MQFDERSGNLADEGNLVRRQLAGAAGLPCQRVEKDLLYGGRRSHFCCWPPNLARCEASICSVVSSDTSALILSPKRRGDNFDANHILVVMRIRSRPTSPARFSAISKHASARASAARSRAARIMMQKCG